MLEFCHPGGGVSPSVLKNLGGSTCRVVQDFHLIPCSICIPKKQHLLLKTFLGGHMPSSHMWLHACPSVVVVVSIYGEHLYFQTPFLLVTLWIAFLLVEQEAFAEKHSFMQFAECDSPIG